MTDTVERDTAHRLARVLGMILVIIGLLNTMPAIPGLDAAFEQAFGKGAVIRRFPYEYLFPLVFVLMMTIVALEHSFARGFSGQAPAKRGFGLFMDVALVTMATLIALGYLIEIDAVCLIDQFTDRSVSLYHDYLIME